MRGLVIVIVICSALVTSARNISDHQGRAPIYQTNLLYIMFDDLRPELSIYGKKHMITPNFERLAAKSVVFDLCITQVAVCNPSRDSLMTGLRPDTMGNYAFQTTYFPNPVFPQHLIGAGYKTSSYGKIRHWDGRDPSVWSHENFEGDWYTYQNWEWDHMNSTVMPDKVRAEETFPDHIFTSKAISNIRKMHAANSNYYMTAVGFKMPHTALHVPYKYYDMYKNRQNVWGDLEEAARVFPKTSPPVSYRCCADGYFKFMNEEGAKPHVRTEELEDMQHVTSTTMYTEMMQGYSAAITFVDKQLGRLLDVLDELDLWKNTTVILTADHGMHNGEKGLWEKWTLFDEATRVPLMIHHPLSPFKGQHYKEAVELVDVYPTVFDLTNAPVDRKTLVGAGIALFSDSKNKGRGERDLNKVNHRARLVQPGGKSLASVVLGGKYYVPQWGMADSKADASTSTSSSSGGGKEVATDGQMPVLGLTFGLSQTWKCAIAAQSHIDVRNHAHMRRQKLWKDCDINNRTNAETSVMGYSMRSTSFRYTAWVHIDRQHLFPDWDQELFEEELYDHRGEALGSLTHYEVVNLAKQPDFSDILVSHRDMLLNFLQTKMVYRNGHKMRPITANTTLGRVHLRGSKGSSHGSHGTKGKGKRGGGARREEEIDGARRRLGEILELSKLELSEQEIAAVPSHREGWWD